jgi:hypothetical protein
MERAGILARVSMSRVPASQPSPIRSLVVQLAAAARPLPAITRPYTPARTFKQKSTINALNLNIFVRNRIIFLFNYFNSCRSQLLKKNMPRKLREINFGATETGLHSTVFYTSVVEPEP